MSELGQLLEAMHGAARSFERFRGVFRIWRHADRAVAAFEAEAEERGGSLSPLRAVSESDEPTPQEREAILRVWVERPDRVREERDGDSFSARLAVRDGSRWWRYYEDMGAISNEGDESAGSGIGEEISALLDPSGLIGALELEATGSGERAGREVLRARATPRRGDPDSPLDRGFERYRLGAGADEYQLEIDAERGVLLRVEARRGGQRFLITEATDAAFDEPFSSATFVFEPPPGEDVRPMKDAFPRHEELPLHEAAARAPFPVFVPQWVPRDWRLEVSLLEGSERSGVPPSVTLWYRSPDAATELHISEVGVDHAGEADPSEGASGASAWREVERGGVTMRVRERVEERPQSELVLTREATSIQMSSSTLDFETMLELAARLVPASTEPPAL